MIRVPEPTTVLMVPAARAATITAKADSRVTSGEGTARPRLSGDPFRIGRSGDPSSIKDSPPDADPPEVRPAATRNVSISVRVLLATTVLLSSTPVGTPGFASPGVSTTGGADRAEAEAAAAARAVEDLTDEYLDRTRAVRAATQDLADAFATTARLEAEVGPVAVEILAHDGDEEPARNRRAGVDEDALHF